MLSRHATKFAPPLDGAVTDVHEPDDSSAVLALLATMLATHTLPAALPTHVAASPAPQPLGPDTASTRYTASDTKLTLMAHTRLEGPTRSSAPTQPPVRVHSVSAYVPDEAAARSAVEGSAPRASMGNAHDGLVPGGTGTKGIAPLTHVYTTTAPALVAPTTHAARLTDTALARSVTFDGSPEL